jgi:hypothetical protein
VLLRSADWFRSARKQGLSVPEGSLRVIELCTELKLAFLFC